MDIKSIQAAQNVQASFRSPEGNSSKADAWTALSSEPSTRTSSVPSSSANAAQSPLIEAQTLVNHINYIKEQLDKILVDFPPFFPPGTFQRADLIEGIRNIQDEVENSSVPTDMKGDISSERLADKATDEEISAALDKLFSIREEMVKKLPEMAEVFDPGAVVSIKV